jgi:hypothetical protein
MEPMLVVLGLAILGIAARLWGADSTPGIDDEPHRSL